MSEQTASARQTDYFLRADLRILDVLPGEPDDKGRQRAAPGRFTLVTKGNASCAGLERPHGKGHRTAPPSLMVNPDLVVEVRDGKIHGLRAEMHVGP